MDTRYHFATRAVHGGMEGFPEGATNPSIVASAGFAFDSAEEAYRRFTEGEGYVYSRYGNPTVRAVEKRLASLERAEDVLLCASGMSAIAITLLSQLGTGDHLLSEESIYGGTLGLFSLLPRLGIEVTLVDTLSRGQLEGALRKNTKILYLETPANPLLKILPLEELAGWAREKGLLSAVDSTFATPYLQRPLELSVDLVVHSATKFLGGHGDLTAGLIAGRKELLEPIRTGWHRLSGPTFPPSRRFSSTAAYRRCLCAWSALPNRPCVSPAFWKRVQW